MKTLLLLLSGTHLIFAGSKISWDVPTSNTPALTEVIVRFKAPPSKDELKAFGPSGQIKKSFDAINALHLVLPQQAIAALAADPNVLYVSPNRSLRGHLDITDQTVGATTAWASGWTGTGVGVAVLDSGITLKPDLNSANGLTSRIVYSQSFVAGEGTNDLYGHGTHVAGIIGSNGASSTGLTFTRTFKGIAPNVNLINLKVLNQTGSGQESDVIAAIQTAIQLKSTYNIRVLNLSLGRPVFESYTLDPLCQAVEAAWKAGIVVVVAAGNSGRDNSMGTHGYGTIQSPGNDPYVITVGATNTRGTASLFDDTVASYSSKGPTLIDRIVKPDLVAPGNGVVSLLASTSATLYASSSTQVKDLYYETSIVGIPVSTDYFRLSGTSMATPAVAGAAALLIQKSPSISPDTVKARLMKTAGKILPTYQNAIDAITYQSFSGQADVFSVGAGYLNVNAALASTDTASLPALSATVTYDGASHHVGIVRNLSITWGDSVTWGDSIIWGTAAFNGQLATGQSIIWGDSVTWGDVTSSGFNVIWSNQPVYTAGITATSEDDSDQ